MSEPASSKTCDCDLDAETRATLHNYATASQALNNEVQFLRVVRIRLQRHNANLKAVNKLLLNRISKFDENHPELELRRGRVSLSQIPEVQELILKYSDNIADLDLKLKLEREKNNNTSSIDDLFELIDKSK